MAAQPAHQADTLRFAPRAAEAQAVGQLIQVAC